MLRMGFASVCLLGFMIYEAWAESLDCLGVHRYNARGTAYYPADDPVQGGFFDMRGKPLNTLQDFLEGRASTVTVAMDNRAGIRYGTKVCIPELNHKYKRVIDFRVRDTGSAFFNKGISRVDICVRSKRDAYDATINGPLTLVFQRQQLAFKVADILARSYMLI